MNAHRYLRLFALLFVVPGLSFQDAENQSKTKPVTPERLSPRATTVWDFSRSQVIERMVERLRGATSLEAWRFAKLALARECDDEEVRAAVIRYLEKHLLTRGEDAPARNAIEVMRRSGRSEFSPLLLRATQHGIRTVSEDAMAALERCADQEAVQHFVDEFASGHARSQIIAMRVIARRGKPELAIPFFQKLLDGQITLVDYPLLTAAVLETFEKGTAPEIVRASLEGRLSIFANTAAAVAAKQLHSAGSEAGRFALLRMLEEEVEKGKDAMRQASLIESLSLRDPALSFDRVLEFAADSKEAAVRLALARFLGTIDDASPNASSVVAMLELLANDEVRDVEHQALTALRGRSKPVVDRLISNLATAEGSELRLAVQALIHAADERAVPAVVARLEKAEGRDRQIFIQALGRMGTKASLPHLREVLCGPSVDYGRDFDSIAYAAIVTTNISESEGMLFELYAATSPESDQDLALRSHLLKTLANLAKEPGGASAAARLARIHARFLDIVMDAKAPASERLLCLDYLRGGELSIDAALQLGRRMRRDASFASDALVARFNDFLNEFF